MTRVDVISIGTLERNRLWQESSPVRTAHATTSLVRSGRLTLLVDPGLPAAVLVARLYERTGLEPGRVDAVFLTNFTAAHRGGLEAFPDARVLMWEREIELARSLTQDMLERDGDDDDIRRGVEAATALLDRINPAEDKLERAIDLFPLPGHTAGTAGLLVTSSAMATLIAGDGVPTLDHFLAGQVLPEAADIELAQESLREAYEIADVVVPGHDNAFLNPRNQAI